MKEDTIQQGNEAILKADIPANIDKMFSKLPIIMDWCSYKGEIVVAQINYDETIRVGRPMMDISYCMTRALSQNIMYTVQFDKKKFSPCRLTHSWGNQTKK
jgi:hypothetical protein